MLPIMQVLPHPEAGVISGEFATQEYLNNMLLDAAKVL